LDVKEVEIAYQQNLHHWAEGGSHADIVLLNATLQRHALPRGATGTTLHEPILV